MGTRISESERNYRALQHSGDIKRAIGSYVIGIRGSETLDMLATAKLWADNIGEWVPCPTGFDHVTWQDILSDLVVKRLGRYRCLDCSRCHGHEDIGPICPDCGGVAEVIGCTEGVKSC